jgi:hypothetical protein
MMTQLTLAGKISANYCDNRIAQHHHQLDTSAGDDPTNQAGEMTAGGDNRSTMGPAKSISDVSSLMRTFAKDRHLSVSSDHIT